MIFPSQHGHSLQRASLTWWVAIVGTFLIALGHHYWADVAFLPAPASWRTFLDSPAHHEIGFVLFALPVVLAAIRFYIKGALITAAIATLAIFPHALNYTTSPDPGFRIASFAAITLLLGGLVGSLLRSKQLLLGQQDDLERFISRSLQVQESEKQHLARELHDGTAQELIDVLHEIDDVHDSAQHDTMTGERLDKLRATVEDVLDGTRRFMQGLRPPQLDELGLLPSLRWLCDEIDAEDDLAAVCELDETQPLPELTKDAELAVFRIVQEALTNVRRHSGARQATVSISPTAQGLRVMIADDGQGFDTRPLGDLASQGKFGLIGLAERARLAGGSARIESTPGHGTRITIAVSASG